MITKRFQKPKKGYYRMFPIQVDFDPSGVRIPGPVFTFSGGFNSVMLLDFPVYPCNGKRDLTKPENWVWQSYPVKFKCFPKFASYCEFLGERFPYWALHGKLPKLQLRLI